MQLRSFEASDTAQVLALWHECNLVRPVNNPEKDIQRKLNVNPELFIVGLCDGRLVATVMAGYEGHRGWINYMAVAPTYRRKGLGRILMTEAERLLAARGCPKINLQVLAKNPEAIAFYRRLGYALDEFVSMGKRIEVDDLLPPVDESVS
jgi:ribosomal protein S18 acetylase RimI-like enzyme